MQRKFRVPFYPVTPVLGIGVNLFLIYQLAISDFVALAIAVSVIAAGVLYYYLIMPKLKYAAKGISIVDIPEIKEHKRKNEQMKLLFQYPIPIRQTDYFILE